MLAVNKGVLVGKQKNLSMGLDELIDECKTFFFAGHETTASLLTFMCLLLATHPEWQERVQEEVFEVCGKTQLPTADALNHLKLVSCNAFIESMEPCFKGTVHDQYYKHGVMTSDIGDQMKGVPS
ncbi:hypothetical protein L7F22_068326 [Adiantum nelumboides]|nr:hypothetical protein [Adiantum nelumboides]